MDRFVNRQNIDRYRKLASEATNATERQLILRLLADEEAKFKLDQALDDLDQTRQPGARNWQAEAAGSK